MDKVYVVCELRPRTFKGLPPIGTSITNGMTHKPWKAFTNRETAVECIKIICDSSDGWKQYHDFDIFEIEVINEKENPAHWS